MEMSVEQKKYFHNYEQEMWNKLKTKSVSELLDLIQEYWSDISGQQEFYFAIQLIRKNLNLKLDDEYFGVSYKDMKEAGCKECDMVEIKI